MMPASALGSIALFAAFVAAPTASQPAPGSRVLVMPFAVEVDPAAPGGAGASYWLGEAAAVLVADDLAALGVGALTRAERLVAFERLQLPMSSALTRATMIRVAELVGASEVVFGEVHLGERLAVRARVIALGAGRELSAVADEAPLADIFPLFARVAGRLAGVAGRRPDGAPRASWQLPIAVFENYVKGLVAATPSAQQRFLEAAVKQAPRDARVLTALADVYAEQGAHERVLAVTSIVPADSTLARRARFTAALSLIELKRFDGAVKVLQELYADTPSAVLSNALGIVQLRRGSTPAAGVPSVYFHRAVAEDPASADYLFNLGYAYAVSGDAPAALHWLREAVRYDAANGDAHLVMSAVLVSSGRTAEGQRELDLARQLGSRLDESALSLTAAVPAGLERLRTDLDVVPAAHAIGNPAERDQREAAAYHLERGRRLAGEGASREAINELRRAIYLTPYEDEPHILLGQLYQRSGRLADAIDELKVALWCRESAAARAALAAAFLESGSIADARREAERALALAPDSADVKELLRKIGGMPSAVVGVKILLSACPISPSTKSSSAASSSSSRS